MKISALKIANITILFQAIIVLIILGKYATETTALDALVWVEGLISIFAVRQIIFAK